MLAQAAFTLLPSLAFLHNSTVESPRVKRHLASCGDRMLRGILNIRLGEVDNHFRFLVADSFDLAGWDADFLTRIPVTSLDDQLTDCPAPVVNKEAGHVPDLSVGRLDRIAGHLASALKMLVVPVVIQPAGLQLVLQRWYKYGIATHSPHGVPSPVRRPTVVAVVLDFELARDRFVGL